MYANFQALYGRLLPDCGALVPVCSLLHLEYLVKESEVVTGMPGRKFIIASADRLAYRIQWQQNGFRVERLDGSGNPLCTMYLEPHEFWDHSLGTALRTGCLFTLTLAL